MTVRNQRRPPTVQQPRGRRETPGIAVAHQPRVLLADEPTGNVDSEVSAGIMELFGQLNEELGSTVLMATHDEWVLDKYPARVIRLRTGTLPQRVAL